MSIHIDLTIKKLNDKYEIVEYGQIPFGKGDWGPLLKRRKSLLNARRLCAKISSEYRKRFKSCVVRTTENI